MQVGDKVKLVRVKRSPSPAQDEALRHLIGKVGEVHPTQGRTGAFPIRVCFAEGVSFQCHPDELEVQDAS